MMPGELLSKVRLELLMMDVIVQSSSQSVGKQDIVLLHVHASIPRPWTRDT
jgi:hypothetical protein